MSALFKCTACGATASFASRNAATDKDWLFAELLSKTRVRYWALCGACRPPWIKAAFGEDDEPAKRKDKKA